MKFHRSLIWRVFLIYAALTLLTLAVLAFFLTYPLILQADDQLQEQQLGQARLAAELAAPYLADADNEDLAALANILANAIDSPVTILATDGTVLARPPNGAALGAVPIGEAELSNVLDGNAGQAVRTPAGGDSHTLFTAAPVMVEERVVGIAHLSTEATWTVGSIVVVLTTLGAWGLTSAGVALLLGWYLARYSSRSLQTVRAVADASQQLEQGEYDHRVPSGAYEETRQLTDSFNHMADTVKSVITRLSSERDTLSAVLETMADGVVATDPGGRVSLFNPAARDLLEIRAEQVEGVRLGELVRDNEIHQLLTRCQDEQARHEAEVSLILPRRYLSAIATPLDNNGGVLLTLHDLTRMRQVETSQREFVSNVSHELRNPMASIKAMVETLESGAVNDTQVALDFLSRMRGDVDRINGLVNDLLELSRMESGQFNIESEPMDLAPLVHAVSKQFRETAASQDVELVAELSENLPQVMADGEKLTQVFVNLVENSLKFTPPGGEIRISADASDGQVQVVFKDTGVGVAPQHLPHIFERFYKVNRSRRDSGTGLGLAIVKQLVEAHGGQIRVESREGEGCLFTFTVPRVP